MRAFNQSTANLIGHEAPTQEPPHVVSDDRTLRERVRYWMDYIGELAENEWYFWGRTIDEVLPGGKVRSGDREMLMLASYSYLGLIGHPSINRAACDAILRYGTGTHGVRLLAGTLPIHRELERAIARFKRTEDAITFASGYATNIAAITTVVGRHDVVICDSYDHASIVDGALLSRADFVRFRHNDLTHLQRCLERAGTKSKLVVVDAVFSMDGDVVDLPRVIELCRRYDARLMVDEAHSIGVLGAGGRGIEEHFGIEDGIDIKMGTLSKTIPAAGGYIAGSKELIHLYRHSARPYIFSAALTPGQAGAALAAFEIIEQEPERVRRVQKNARRLLSELKSTGLNTLSSETPIIPLVFGSREKTYRAAQHCHERGIFVLPVVSPAVPEGLSRLRLTTCADHDDQDIDRALDVLKSASRAVGLI